eukprot:TRINITY_DN1159_c0_g1_i1.p1 TRINITY_DN1159_c0_g1~~TRINITY_DN1159_c0_g1_i1.p1  ORF type:complete len:137 (-),score=14.61 TRINITY_DN1159_c0_g1_i1:180-566(-)
MADSETAPNEPLVDTSGLSVLSVDTLNELEAQARLAGQEVDRLLQAFNSALSGITTMSVQHMTTYRQTVDGTADAMIEGVQKMNEFVTKCTSLKDEVHAADDITLRVRQIKDTVDALERAASKIPALK